MVSVFDSKNPYQWYYRGNVLYKNKQYSEALQCLDNALAINPGLDRPWYVKGNIYRDLSQFDDAIAAYLEALKREPKSAFACFGLGTVYALQGRDDDAIESFNRALSINNRLDKPWAAKGDIYLKKGDYSQARECYQKSLSIDPRNERAAKGLNRTFPEEKSSRDSIRTFPEEKSSGARIGTFPEEKSSGDRIGTFIDKLLIDRQFSPQIRHREIIEEREPLYYSPDLKLHPSIQTYLMRKNIRLYAHQAETIKSVLQGKNAILCTSTASGKSLAFTIPVIENLIKDSNATALFLYPTKALTQDQLLQLSEWDKEIGISINAGIYDGDTPSDEKERIKNESKIVLSNPFMLNRILPWHRQWVRLYSGLKFVIIDEAHRYRGVFGSNVGLLLRRLRRVCRLYGSNPVFILTSATIHNPKDFAEKMIDLPVQVIDSDGSPTGKKHFLLYNPDFYNHQSTDGETVKLLVKSVREGFQTICFTNSRKRTESIAMKAREKLETWEKGSGKLIRSYRSGYLPSERRELERDLKNNVIKGIVSTNALELGIDIGSLDVAILSGYPGTIMAARQQAGRAGRSRKESLSILVAFQSPLDQHFIRHPKEFFSAKPEDAIIDLDNPYIKVNHTLCAAKELPLRLPEDEVYFGTALDQTIQRANKSLIQINDSWEYNDERPVHEIVNLAYINPNTYIAVDGSTTLETLDITQMYREAYPGAIMLHQGKKYRVLKTDLEQKIISTEKIETDLTTNPIIDTEISIVKECQSYMQKGIPVYYGIVQVTQFIQGYLVYRGNEIIAQHKVDLPPLKFVTKALWFPVPDLVVDGELDPTQFQSGINGLENAIGSIVPYFTMCDRKDIGGANSMVPGERSPFIFIYDDVEGGIGLAENAYSRFSDVIEKTHETVTDCPCDSGCHGCILSPRISDNNRDIDKKSTRALLDALVWKIANTT